MLWFLREKNYLLISVIMILLDGLILYFIPTYFNNLNYFYPMLLITLIPFLYHDNLKDYYKLIFILGIIYDLLYTNIFLYNAILFLIIGKMNIKILNNYKDNIIIYLILIIINIMFYDTIGFILVYLTNYQLVTIDDLLYKIIHSLILNIMSGIVYYFLFKKRLFIHKINW